MANNKTFTITENEVSKSGTGLVHFEWYIIGPGSKGDIPDHSEITDAKLTAYIKETSNKLGNADLYVYLRGFSSEIVKELYYGNGVIPKSSTFYSKEISIKDYIKSKEYFAGDFNNTISYIDLQCKSSLLSRNYTAKITLKFTYNEPRAIVTVNGGSGGGTYHYGNTYTITATPPTGYKFIKWEDGDTNISRKITVDSSLITAYETKKTYTAVFEKLPPEFTSASMTYLNKQISATNKVPCGEGFIISVGVK